MYSKRYKGEKKKIPKIHILRTDKCNTKNLFLSL